MVSSQLPMTTVYICWLTRPGSSSAMSTQVTTMSVTICQRATGRAARNVATFGAIRS